MDRQELLRVPGHVTKLTSSLYHLQQQGCMCDCDIHTKQGIVRVHRVVILAGDNGYLQQHLCTSMTNDVLSSSYILLEDQDVSVVQCITQFVYTGEMHVCLLTAQKVLSLCQLLGLTEAEKLCERFIQKYTRIEGIPHQNEDLKTTDISDITTEKKSVCAALNYPLLLRSLHKSGTAPTNQKKTDIISSDTCSQSKDMNVFRTVGMETKKYDKTNDRNLNTEEYASHEDDENMDINKMDTDVFNGVTLESKCTSSPSSANNGGNACSTVTSLTPNTPMKNNEQTFTDPTGQINTFGNQKTLDEGQRSDDLIKNYSNEEVYGGQSSDAAKDNKIQCSKEISGTNVGKYRLCKSSVKTGSEKTNSDEKYRESCLSNFCRTCKVRFPDRKKFLEHKKVTHPFTCDMCGWCSDRGLNLASHIYNQHNIHYMPDKYPLHHCNHQGCDFKSIKKHTVSVHRKIHSDERKFRCNLCDSSFKYRSQYNCHMKTHNPDNLTFKCELCDKSFPRKSLLNAHTKTVHKRDELCHLCPWKSSSRRELHIHLLRVHDIPLPTNFKIYHCNKCDYYTFTKLGYRSHMDFHNGNTYQCKECGKILNTEMKLYVHERKHKVEAKWLHCPYPNCDYKTLSNRTLKSHQSVRHSEYKPFQCHLCEYQGKVKGNLDKHLRRKHNMEVMTVNKLWDKVKKTGQGYGNIVNRLMSFKTKGAVGMANEGDTYTRNAEERDINV